MPSQVTIDGPVHVVGPDGYRLATSDVLVDLTTAMQSPARSGAMRLGQFQAGQLSADLDERTVRWRRSLA